MSEVTIDLSNYKDRVGSRIQPGRYRVVVDDAEQDVSKAGNTMVNLWFRVMDGDFAGSTLIDRLVLSEKSLFRVVGFMQAIGMPTPRKKLRLNIRSFVGKVLEIDVEDGDPYNGRVKSEVRGYMRVTSASNQMADLDALEDEAAPTLPLEEIGSTVTASIEEAGSPNGSSDEALDLDTLTL